MIVISGPSNATAACISTDIIDEGADLIVPDSVDIDPPANTDIDDQPHNAEWNDFDDADMSDFLENMDDDNYRVISAHQPTSDNIVIEQAGTNSNVPRTASKYPEPNMSLQGKHMKTASDDPFFIDHYLGHSRLHHLATWGLHCVFVARSLRVH